MIFLVINCFQARFTGQLEDDGKGRIYKRKRFKAATRTRSCEDGQKLRHPLWVNYLKGSHTCREAVKIKPLGKHDEVQQKTKKDNVMVCICPLSLSLSLSLSLFLFSRRFISLSLANMVDSFIILSSCLLDDY